MYRSLGAHLLVKAAVPNLVIDSRMVRPVTDYTDRVTKEVRRNQRERALHSLELGSLTFTAVHQRLIRLGLAEVINNRKKRTLINSD